MTKERKLKRFNLRFYKTLMAYYDACDRMIEGKAVKLYFKIWEMILDSQVNGYEWTEKHSSFIDSFSEHFDTLINTIASDATKRNIELIFEEKERKIMRSCYYVIGDTNIYFGGAANFFLGLQVYFSVLFGKIGTFFGIYDTEPGYECKKIRFVKGTDKLSGITGLAPEEIVALIRSNKDPLFLTKESLKVNTVPAETSVYREIPVSGTVTLLSENDVNESFNRAVSVLAEEGIYFTGTIGDVKVEKVVKEKGEDN